MLDFITLTGTGQAPLTFPGRLVATADGRYYDAPPDVPNSAWFAISVYQVPLLVMYSNNGRDPVVLHDCQLAKDYAYDPENIPSYVISVAFHSFANGEWKETVVVSPAARIEEFLIEGFWPGEVMEKEHLTERLEEQFHALAETVFKSAAESRFRQSHPARPAGLLI